MGLLLLAEIRGRTDGEDTALRAALFRDPQRRQRVRSMIELQRRRVLHGG